MIGRQIAHRAPWHVAVIGTMALLTACATTPQPTDPALADARSAFRQAEADPRVTEHAGVALENARQALAGAEQAAADDADDLLVSHFAYLAQRRAEIALLRGREGAAHQQAEQLAEERAQLTAQLRGIESQAYRQEAIAAQARVRELETELAALEVQTERNERGLVLTLEDVIFEFDSARLKPGARQKLDPIATFLEQNPEREAVIEGHTDGVGSDEYNRQLSRDRAEAVRDYLAGHGVEGTRLLAEGYGERYPVASNTTEAGRQHNRRVEIVIPPEGVPAEQRMR